MLHQDLALSKLVLVFWIFILGSRLCHLTARSCMFLKREYKLKMIYSRCCSLNHDGNKAVSRTNKEAGNRASHYMLSSPEQVARGILEFVHSTFPRVQKSNSSGIPTLYQLYDTMHGVLHHDAHTQNTEFGSRLCQLRVL
jgi:hypothetical protein